MTPAPTVLQGKFISLRLQWVIPLHPTPPMVVMLKTSSRRWRAKLYPAPTATLSQVDKSLENGGSAFRYKVLLYNTDGTSDVTNHFEQIGDWYGEAERTEIKKQIRILRVALANAPYSADLRNVLLDAYTDRAVAELQFIKQDLVFIAKKRLGLELTDQFVIDDEIASYESVIARLTDILAQYQELLTDEMDGVETTDIDPDAKPGTPFGYYVFQQQQPKRNITPSRYFRNTKQSHRRPHSNRRTRGLGRPSPSGG